MHSRATWWSFVWCSLWLSTSLGIAGESLTEVVPPGAILSAELTDASAAITQTKSSEGLRAITDSELYRTWANSKDGRKFRGGRAVLEGQLGMNLWDAAEKLVGRQVLLALYPPSEGDQPDSVLVIRLADLDTATLIREKLTPWIEIADGAILAEERDDNWLVESADGKIFALLKQDWLVLSNRKSLREDVLGRLTTDAQESLAQSPAWKGQPGLSEETKDTRLAIVWDSAPVRTLLGPEHGTRLLPAKLDNPLGSLLLGGLLEVVSQSPDMTGNIVLDASGITASVLAPVGRGEVDEAHQTLLASTKSATDFVPAVPRQLGTIVLCRDWPNWYRQREALIEEQVLPEFDKFETGLSNLLPGKDFCEDVLTLLNSPITFVAAEQTYPYLDGRPGMQLPAFAVVLDLTNADRGADIFQLFFQTLGTIVNIEAGKSGRQPWVMHSQAHQEVQITYAKYLDRPQGGDLPVVYNFQPAAALVGQKYVAATSLELCRDLIDGLQHPTERTGAEVTTQNFNFTIDPTVAARLLESNRAVITARRIQEGRATEQANGELDAVVNWLERLTPLSITTEVTEETLELRLHGGWK